jgi:hypothetical protein
MVRVTIAVLAKDEDKREVLASTSWTFPVCWRSSVESIVGRLKGIARAYDATNGLRDRVNQSGDLF